MGGDDGTIFGGDPELPNPPSAQGAKKVFAPAPCATPCRGAAETPKVPDPAAETPKVPDPAAGTPHTSPKSIEGSPKTDVDTPSSEDSAGAEDGDRPIPGELRLSENAINLRLHRLMRIDAKGNSKVSDQIRKQFHGKKGKLQLQQVFQSCGYNPDWCGQTYFVLFQALGGLIQRCIIIENSKLFHQKLYQSF